MILIRYYDSCSCESITIDCTDMEDAKSQLKLIVSSDITSDVEIYECEKVFWDITIFKTKERNK